MHLGGINQAAQAGVPQNPAFFTTPNFGNVHSLNQARQQINQNQQNNSVQGTQVTFVFFVDTAKFLVFIHIFKLR